MMQRTLFSSRLSLLRSPVLAPSYRSFSPSIDSPRSLSSDSASTTTSGTATTSSTPPFAAAPATSSTIDQETAIESKYFVPRSQFGELPVYSDVRNGGTRVLTIIRKVHGDVSELHKDLSQFLHPSTASFTKPQTQQIVIKGDWVREVKEWLAHRGF